MTPLAEVISSLAGADCSSKLLCVFAQVADSADMCDDIVRKVPAVIGVLLTCLCGTCSTGVCV
jgi:hypothetical protein